RNLSRPCDPTWPIAPAGLAAELREHALELHGVGHVALDLELALHERGHAVELAARHVLPVGPGDLDGGVGRAVGFGYLLGGAVEHDDALVAEIELHLLARNIGVRTVELRRHLALVHDRL